MKLSLPYPAKELWPNARPHWAAKARETKKLREYAYWLAKQATPPKFGNGPIPVKITIFPQRYGPVPDRDNCLSACKAALDGIAQAIGINDRYFHPVISIGAERASKVIVEVGHG